MAKKKTSTENAATRGSVSTPTRVRLQRALASAGFGSRRHCEELIAEGRVIVDGEVADQLGTTVDLSTQKVFVDGSPLKPRRPIYYALNKPVGVVTTSVDPEGRPRVIDLVPPDERVFAVGRLDRNSEGLILLTNDGELAQKLAHPRFEIQKVYRVVVAGRVETETLKQMERGIHIAEGLVRVEGAKLLKVRGRATELEIVLREGKNREIRRILARLGHKVQQLKRIAIGPLRLGEMPVGAHRQLSPEELKKLRAAVDTDHSGGEPGVAPERRTKTGPRKRPGGPAKTFGRKNVSGRPASASANRDRSETPVPAARKRRPKDLLDLSGGGKSKSIGTVIGADETASKTSNKSRERSPENAIIQPRRKAVRVSEADAETRPTKTRRFSDRSERADSATTGSATTGDDKRGTKRATGSRVGKAEARVGKSSSRVGKASSRVGKSSSRVGKASARIGKASSRPGKSEARVGKSDSRGGKAGTRRESPGSGGDRRPGKPKRGR